MLPLLPSIPAPRRVHYRRAGTSNRAWLFICRQRWGLDWAVWKDDLSRYGGRGRKAHMSQIRARVAGKNTCWDAIPQKAEEVKVQPYGGLHPVGFFINIRISPISLFTGTWRDDLGRSARTALLLSETIDLEPRQESRSALASNLSVPLHTPPYSQSGLNQRTNIMPKSVQGGRSSQGLDEPDPLPGASGGEFI